jgi:hypothetical protein
LSVINDGADHLGFLPAQLDVGGIGPRYSGREFARAGEVDACELAEDVFISGEGEDEVKEAYGEEVSDWIGKEVLVK